MRKKMRLRVSLIIIVYSFCVLSSSVLLDAIFRKRLDSMSNLDCIVRNAIFQQYFFPIFSNLFRKNWKKILLKKIYISYLGQDG